MNIRDSKPGEKVTITLSVTETEFEFNLHTPEGGNTELAYLGYLALRVVQELSGAQLLSSESYDADGLPLASANAESN